MDGVVDPLVDRRLDVSVRPANAHHLRDLPSTPRSISRPKCSKRKGDDARSVVADPEALELALFVEIVDGFERDFVRRRAVRSV